MRASFVLFLSLVSLWPVAVSAQEKTRRPAAPEAAEAGAPSKKWDMSYSGRTTSSSGILVCPRAIQLSRSARDSEPNFVIKNGKVKLPLRVKNMGYSGIGEEYFDRCDDAESESESICETFVTRKKELAAAGLPTAQELPLGDLEISIDAEGHVKGALQPEPLPELPAFVDDDDRRAWSNNFKQVAVTSGQFTQGGHRNAAGYSSGSTGTVRLSTMGAGRRAGNSTCDVSFVSADYKAVAYCAASRAACRSDSDCCNHNCVPSTRSCR